MQVDIRSYLKDGTEPYKPFRVCLDRSGATQEIITAAIVQALSELKAADAAPPVEALTPDKLNTEFRYHLRDQRSRKTARLGMEDLRLIYDEARGQAVEFCPFRDIPRQLAEGTLRSASGRFVLEASGLDGAAQDVVPA